MESTITIRSEIEDYIRRTGKGINGLSQSFGLNKGILSAIINRNPPKPISVRQLDIITAGMELPEGALYELYIDEIIVSNPLNWRRLKPFLQRCAELEKYNCIEEVLQGLVDDLSFIPGIFNTAELLYEQGLIQAALMLYECVAEGEKYQHSERLAICQYRIFKTKLGQDNTINLKIASQFEPFMNRLPEDEQLDALRDLGNVYTTLHAWKRVDEIANQLENLVSIIYKVECESNKYDESNRKTKYPLVVYYGQVYLMKVAVYDNAKDYEQAKEYNNRYANLSWFMGLGAEGKVCVNNFRMWSKANAYVFDLKTGKTDTLSEYVSYIEDKEYEILPGLEMIMKSANEYNLNVDHILLQFEDRISSYFQSDFVGEGYKQQFSMDRYTTFFYELAYYYFKNSRQEMAITYVLASLGFAVKINNKACIILCMKLFEELRDFASMEVLHKYKNTIKGVHEDAENDIFFVGS
ncbi:hypothetical protein [Paenibacillus crassostreae]|uniref:DNA-binding protein n=1 Tax=Paenibacillus crassostreae TaxID=1763538 RepID=A0A167EJC2_9BACL|nr:hypothetical protein [Paenibacillus crassostreae]AOZ94916.1 hypothetical protein LPB68_21895 [Paenibacillus crassostreae]OAB75598.1 hypothetical protein PNBC_08185 [Paenibacillus crassostreae]